MTTQPPPNRPDPNPDAIGRLEELLNAYTRQLLAGKAAEAARAIENALPDIAQALIAAAKAGGVQACRLCFDLASSVPPDDEAVVESPGDAER